MKIMEYLFFLRYRRKTERILVLAITTISAAKSPILLLKMFFPIRNVKTVSIKICRKLIENIAAYL
jgi:hypothetical protein